VGQPPPAGEVHPRDSGQRCDDPPEIRAYEADQQQDGDELASVSVIRPLLWWAKIGRWMLLLLALPVR
jgi:hypothetical protein